MNSLWLRADVDWNNLMCKGIAFSELVPYKHGNFDPVSVDFVLKMSDLTRNYEYKLDILLRVKIMIVLHLECWKEMKPFLLSFFNLKEPTC